MSISLRTLGPSDRMIWFDANRAIAALGVVLIHCTSDFSGQPFSGATVDERLGPIVIRALAETTGSEMFFLFSLFLLSFKLERRRPSYVFTLRDQAKRLLIPFAFWTLFYAFFRLFKASTFGYSGAILSDLSTWQSWLSYAVLGSASYHLHFLPTLFALVFFYPVMRLAIRYPIVGFLVIVMLATMNAVQGYLWSVAMDASLREYLFRAVKIMGYVGYGFAAFALYGFWKQGVPRGEAKLIKRAALFMVAFSIMATIPYFGTALKNGAWPVRSDWAFYGHFLVPIFVFGAFMGNQYANWSPRWSHLARYTFGVYLVHPLFIDVYDIALYRSGIALTPTAMVLTKFVLVSLASFGCAFLLSRLSVLAWTIGLGPFPNLGTMLKPKVRTGTA